MKPAPSTTRLRSPLDEAPASRSITACNEPEIDSAELLDRAACIAIRHGGERYWLRATRQGRLLLTK